MVVPGGTSTSRPSILSLTILAGAAGAGGALIVSAMQASYLYQGLVVRGAGARLDQRPADRRRLGVPRPGLDPLLELPAELLHDALAGECRRVGQHADRLADHHV